MGIDVSWGLVVIDKNLIPDGKDIERTLHVLQQNNIITMDSLKKGKEAIDVHMEKKNSMINFYFHMDIPNNKLIEWKKSALELEEYEIHSSYGHHWGNPNNINFNKDSEFYYPRYGFSMHVYDEPLWEAYEDVCTNIRFSILMAIAERNEQRGLREFVDAFDERERALIYQLSCLFPKRHIFARVFYH